MRTPGRSAAARQVRAAGFSRPIPLSFGEHEHVHRRVKASHTVALLSVAVVAFLGALQVIGTQAQSDEAILRELSQRAKVAEVSSGVSSLSIASPLTSAIESPSAAPLDSRTASGVQVAPATGPTEAPEQGLAVEPTPEAAPTEAAATSGACVLVAGEPYCVYAVQEGDTLWAIAENLGLEGTAAFSAAELIALSNGLNDAENWLIRVGQELRVPVDSGVIHTVGESETLSVLAELYGVPVADVVAANGLADANSVVVGATLLIPSPSLWPLSGPAAPAQALEAPTEEATPEEAQATATPEAALATAETPEGGADAETVETPGATASAEPAAQTESRLASTATANPSVTEIRDLFAAGYIAAGGPPEYLEYLLNRVIACESGYNLRAFNPAGPFYGLMQFLPQTWANTGGGDWFDAWQQGHNTGVLLQTANPAGQWPVCWL